jgi:elongation factor P--beta-lysine ligase
MEKNVKIEAHYTEWYKDQETWELHPISKEIKTMVVEVLESQILDVVTIEDAIEQKMGNGNVAVLTSSGPL